MLEPDDKHNPDQTPNVESPPANAPELPIELPNQAADATPAAPPAKRARKSTARATADGVADEATPKAARKASPKAAAATKAPRKAALEPMGDAAADVAAVAEASTEEAPPRKATKRGAKKTSAPAAESAQSDDPADSRSDGSGGEPVATAKAGRGSRAIPTVLFVAPSEVEPTPARVRQSKSGKSGISAGGPAAPDSPADPDAEVAALVEDELEDVLEDVREVAAEEATGARRRRRRGRRGRGRARDDASDGDDDDEDDDEADGDASTEAAGEAGDDGDDADAGSPASRRRRRRRRAGGAAGGDGDATPDDPPNTVTHVRERRNDNRNDNTSSANSRDDDGVRGVKGSTRLEAKRQRRRDGRETGRRRPSILSEAEFLARRESVDRVMAVRQRGDRTQIAVLEDGILVEHYVTRASATSYVGNVYLGRVQNVLPSMEAAFVDIGKGRNGVLYAGEVNWDAAGLEGKARTIEGALNSGDAILVQVTKDPIGHKGARLTSQISLPGRFLVYVPGGGMTGISRKLPDTERTRLKSILKKIVPDDAGVIIRTAAEGASEEELTHDVRRLTQEWEAISTKASQKKSAPVQLHGEPDLAIRVVRDVFNEDFKQLIVEGEEAWEMISTYVGDVAPDLVERVTRQPEGVDLFHQMRVDEQLAKALDRKVYLPSGGSLVIDRTEAMTVIDVNTGKYIGSGGNLEQTVTRNNLEAAEEIVRQLRLRDVGGIVVIDFIDMVLESNRELVLRRLTECLGRDRTKHQVAEVTSLGLVQMTRKRVGEGLLEAFSEPCEVCHGRGVILHSEPIVSRRGEDADEAGPPRRRSSRRDRGNGTKRDVEDLEQIDPEKRRAAASAMVAIHKAAVVDGEESADTEDPAVLSDDAVDAIVDEPFDVLMDDLAVIEGAETAEAADAVELADLADQTLAEPAPFTEAVNGGEPAPVGRPSAVRRRRAASRPAGPPAEQLEPGATSAAGATGTAGS